MDPQQNNVVHGQYTLPSSESLGASDALVAAESPLLRFRLRHLLLFVAALSAVMAAVVSLHGIPVIAILLGALVVALHVLATALGSELRLRANRRHDGRFAATLDDAGTMAQNKHWPRPSLQPLECPCFGRSGAALAWLPRLVASAVLFGGCLGAIFLTVTIGDRTSPAGIIVGAMSIAVVSGWFGFIGGNFYAIFRRGLREAIADDRQDSTH